MAKKKAKDASSDSGEQAAETTATEQSVADAGGAAVQDAPRIGDPCKCPDGRRGTIQAGSSEGTFVCLPNHQG